MADEMKYGKDHQANHDSKVREAPLTYDDYANMPDDGIRYELASGVLEAMAPAPHLNHQLFLHKLTNVITETCESDYIIVFAPVDVILSNTEVRQPDLIMLHRSRMHLLSKRGIEGPPNLVVEILSPSSVKRDREDKRKSYAQYGVAEYWIIDINNVQLEQYVLNSREYVLEEVFTEDASVHSMQLPCISFSMRELVDKLPDLPN